MIFVTVGASNPARADKYSLDHRSRVHRFVDVALATFRDVLLVPGNHDHCDGIFDDTASTLARFLLGVRVLLDAEGKEVLRKFEPRDALAAFDASIAALRASHRSAEGRQMIVISHHPPTRKGLGNGLDDVCE